jgi:tRNA/rRNA methyltransferase
MTACWADDILDSMRIHPSLEEALTDFESVIAFSGREGKNRGAPLDLISWGDSLLNTPAVRTALVFGPEDNGLRQEHIELARLVLRIPSSAECPSFNLAQAVILALFEIARREPPQAGGSTERVAAAWNDYFQLDRLLERVMTLSGFLRVGTPEPVPGLVKNLFRRIDLDKREMGILLGLFGRLDRLLTRRGGSGGEPPDDCVSS